jgi:hypothetical protein
MADINDVRKALFAAYRNASRRPGGIEGGFCEGWCVVKYPALRDANTPEQFAEPYELEVYSYALGPSRIYHFKKADKESHPNYYTWCGPDIFALAVRVIGDWDAEAEAREQEDAEGNWE